MKKYISVLVPVAALLIGLSLLLYPSFSDWWNSFHQSRAIDSYTQAVENLDEAGTEALLQAAKSYNLRLLQRSNHFLLSDDEKTEYRNLLDTGGNGIMGYVEIPDIGVMLPIYHGTAESVLQVAVGHLEWTSLPVGGESSHCVLSGHRGLPSARLFTDLDALEEGDIFHLSVLGQKLSYQVDQITVAEPHETEELMIRQGEDLCTLVTCTPYGINSHRLLVRGSRIRLQTKNVLQKVTADAVRLSAGSAALILGIPVLVLGLIILLLPRKKQGGYGDEWI